MSSGGPGRLEDISSQAPEEITVTPNMIQAVARTRMADFMRAADRHRTAVGAAEPRRTPFDGPRSVRNRRRLRIGLA
jgi:hypothetical protein